MKIDRVFLVFRLQLKWQLAMHLLRQWYLPFLARNHCKVQLRERWGGVEGDKVNS